MYSLVSAPPTYGRHLWISWVLPDRPGHRVLLRCAVYATSFIPGPSGLAGRWRILAVIEQGVLCGVTVLRKHNGYLALLGETGFYCLLCMWSLMVLRPIDTQAHLSYRAYQSYFAALSLWHYYYLVVPRIHVTSSMLSHNGSGLDLPPTGRRWLQLLWPLSGEPRHPLGPIAFLLSYTAER